MLDKHLEKKLDPKYLSDRLANLHNGRDEMNLCELPFATLSDRHQGKKSLHFEVDDFDSVLRKHVRRTLTVHGDSEHGLPTEKDEEIYLGLMKYTSDYNGFADPVVHFSRTDLFDLMGWPRSDWAYARLTKGMHRLVGVRLQYQKMWRDNRNKQWRDQGAFGILDSFEFRDCRAVGKLAKYAEHHSVFRWGSVLFESFDSGYLKRMDFGLARKLSPTARRLYRYLDKHFFPPQKTTIVIDVKRLAYEHIGVSRGIEPDKIRKRYIGPAAEELVKAGYLNPAKEWRFQKQRGGVWNVQFELATTEKRSDCNVTNLRQRLVEGLCRRGVSTQTALDIVEKDSPQSVKRAIRAMDEQLRKGIQIRAADRWMRAALKQVFQPSEPIQRSSQRPELKVFRGHPRPK